MANCAEYILESNPSLKNWIVPVNQLPDVALMTPNNAYLNTNDDTLYILNPKTNTVVAVGKDTFTAGSGISIEGNVISATGQDTNTTYTLTLEGTTLKLVDNATTAVSTIQLPTSQGPKGDPGEQGPEGPAGATGAQGAQGPAGAQAEELYSFMKSDTAIVLPTFTENIEIKEIHSLVTFINTITLTNPPSEQPAQTLQNAQGVVSSPDYANPNEGLISTRNVVRNMNATSTHGVVGEADVFFSWTNTSENNGFMLKKKDVTYTLHVIDKTTGKVVETYSNGFQLTNQADMTATAINETTQLQFNSTALGGDVYVTFGATLNNVYSV